MGRDGKTVYQRLKGKLAKVQGMTFAEGLLCKRKRAKGQLGQLTSMWEGQRVFGSHSNHGTSWETDAEFGSRGQFEESR